MNINEPCLFSKFAVHEEQAVDGCIVATGKLVGCVLLEVDDHLMDGSGRAHHASMERLRQRIKIWKVAPIAAEAPESESKALRAVAGSLSWVARQCRPDEAGTASTLQGSVSRAVVKDLSDANLAVNRLKQTEEVGLLIHANLLVDLRTVSISDAALDLDRPFGSAQGGFDAGFHHISTPPARVMPPTCPHLWLARSS